MRFHCDGADYDTDQMTAFPTGNRAMPFIYLSGDSLHVFVQTMDSAQGVSIRHGSADEIRRLAETYHLPALLRAVPNPTDVPRGDGFSGHRGETGDAWAR